MEQELPRSPLQRFLRFVYGHQVLSWLGFTVGLVSLLSAPAAEAVGPALALGIVGWGLAGIFLLGLLGAYIVRPNEPVTCERCEKEYQFSGERGCQTTTTEVQRFRANLPVIVFNYSRLQMDGTALSDTIFYRNLGKDGKNNGTPWALLSEADFAISDIDPKTTVMHLMPPGGVKRGDIFEVKRVHELQNCFPADRERVGKNALFPIHRLSFDLLFEGCPVRDCHGALTINETIKLFDPLAVTVQLDGGYRVQWTVDDANADDVYRLTWYWV